MFISTYLISKGHGDGGERVSQYALTEIQNRLMEHPLFESNVQEALRSTFVDVDKSLANQPHIEVSQNFVILKSKKTKFFFFHDRCKDFFHC